MRASRVKGGVITYIFIMLGIWLSHGNLCGAEAALVVIAGFLMSSFGSIINYYFDRTVDKKSGKDVSFMDFISKTDIAVFSMIMVALPFLLSWFIDSYWYIVYFSMLLLYVALCSPTPEVKNSPSFGLFN